MNQPAIDWTLFDRALQQDNDLSGRLLDALQQERSALESRNYSALDALIAEKQQLVGQLEKNADARRHWLQQKGFTNENAALTAVQQQSPAIAGRWQNAASRWRECQTANQINEQICRRTRLVVERVLDILRGQHSQSATYDASGHSQRGEPGRTISSA